MTVETGTRSRWVHVARAAGAAALLAALAPVPAAQAQQKVLRAVMHADVRVLDPMWTTQTIANIHGMLIYDTLFGNDNAGVPHKQMVDTYTLSDDRKTYTFTLRPGLKFHDGSPVTPKAVIASLKRWSVKDGAGQRLMSYVDRMEVVDDKTFTMVLNAPYGLVLETLGKTASAPMVMREEEALTDPQQQVKEAIGSGPFKFAKDEWVPGSKAVYLKNADYVPRPGNEKAEGFAGSKFPGVDRIELLWIADSQTAMSALINGEIDYWESPPNDFLPMLQSAKGVKLFGGKVDTTWGTIRLNHKQPPFDNVKARQAMYRFVHQEDFLRAIVGNPEYYKVCYGVVPCGTPLQNDAGVKLQSDYNPKKGLELLKEAGWKGEPITILNATDHYTISPANQVFIQALRDGGVNLDVQSMDWGSVVSRRAKKDPPSQGGWNVMITTSGTANASNPVINTWLGASCDKANVGWPCDEKLEALRNDFGFAATDDERMRLARAIQERAIEQVVYIPFGQWAQPQAYRADRLDGLVDVNGVHVLWNVVKK